jgi:hypothetical protein
MIVKRTFVGSVTAVLALLFAAAAPADTPWLEHDATEHATYTLPSGDFASLSDTITFTLASPSNLMLFGESSFPGIAGQAVLNFGSTPLTPTDADYPNSFFLFPSSTFSFVGLAAGAYALKVGIMAMPGGGTFNLTSTISAVPEPATYALLLVGLGVIAVAARRRGLRA